jgi:hypothetical protein
MASASAASASARSGPAYGARAKELVSGIRRADGGIPEFDVRACAVVHCGGVLTRWDMLRASVLWAWPLWAWAHAHSLPPGGRGSPAACRRDDAPPTAACFVDVFLPAATQRTAAVCSAQ